MSETDSDVEFIKEKKMKTCDFPESESGTDDAGKSTGDEIDGKDAKIEEEVGKGTVKKAVSLNVCR